MTRFKVTVRGDGVELRGYVDNYLPGIARVMEPYGVVVASEASDDYNPFGITEPDYPPSLENSIDVLTGIAASSAGIVSLIENFASLHYGQAMVIRGERFQREQAEAELRNRELHHFEVEQENDELRAEATRIADTLEGNWEQGDLAGAVNEAIAFLRGMESKA
jgi:hypothetical protein